MNCKHKQYITYLFTVCIKVSRSEGIRNPFCLATFLHCKSDSLSNLVQKLICLWFFTQVWVKNKRRKQFNCLQCQNVGKQKGFWKSFYGYRPFGCYAPQMQNILQIHDWSGSFYHQILCKEDEFKLFIFQAVSSNDAVMFLIVNCRIKSHMHL